MRLTEVSVTMGECHNETTFCQLAVPSQDVFCRVARICGSQRRSLTFLKDMGMKQLQLVPSLFVSSNQMKGTWSIARCAHTPNFGKNGKLSSRINITSPLMPIHIRIYASRAGVANLSKFSFH